MTDLNTWSSDDFAARPDVLVALVNVYEEASSLSVTDPRHPTFRINLDRLRRECNRLAEIASRTPA